jgi:hypothetical protein
MTGVYTLGADCTPGPDQHPRPRASAVRSFPQVSDALAGASTAIASTSVAPYASPSVVVSVASVEDAMTAPLEQATNDYPCSLERQFPCAAWTHCDSQLANDLEDT